jgi:hypothetical protein
MADRSGADIAGLLALLKEKTNHNSDTTFEDNFRQHFPKQYYELRAEGLEGFRAGIEKLKTDKEFLKSTTGFLDVEKIVDYFVKNPEYFSTGSSWHQKQFEQDYPELSDEL